MKIREQVLGKVMTMRTAAATSIAMANAAMLGAMVTYAEEAAVANPFESAETTVTNLFNGLLSTLRSISTIIAVVMVVICGIGIVTTKDSKKTEAYWSWIKRIVVGVILIWGVPWLIELAKSVGTSFTTA